MSKIKAAVLIYSVTAFMTAFFMIQQLCVTLPRMSVHMWPTVLGLLFTVGAWLLPREAFDVPENKHTRNGRLVLFGSPSRMQLRMISLCTVLLLPFLSWIYSPVRYTASAWVYMCLMSFLALVAVLWAVMNFSCKLRDLAQCHCPAGAARAARGILCVWIYGMIVPAIAILLCKTISDAMVGSIGGMAKYLLSANSTLLTSGVIPGYLGGAAAFCSLFSAVASSVILCSFREQQRENQVIMPDDTRTAESDEDKETE